MTIPIALTIAGSDSSGGAGIQADLKTFAAFSVYGASVITALTAQNTVGVSGIHPVPADFVTAQIDAVFGDLDVKAVKIGMVAQRALIDAIVEGLERWSPKHVVLDPVMVATSGDRLIALRDTPCWGSLMARSGVSTGYGPLDRASGASEEPGPTSRPGSRAPTRRSAHVRAVATG